MTRLRFHKSLDELKEKLLVVAGMAEQSIQRAVEAYRTRDLSICDLVDRGEMAINRLEREIDQMALDLLAQEQPMAIDLRFILSVIKINGDLERVGDQSMSIAIRTQELLAYDAVDLLDADALFADTVIIMDDEIDRMNREARTALMKVMEEQPAISLQALNAIII